MPSVSRFASALRYVDSRLEPVARFAARHPGFGLLVRWLVFVAVPSLPLWAAVDPYFGGIWFVAGGIYLLMAEADIS